MIAMLRHNIQTYAHRSADIRAHPYPRVCFRGHICMGYKVPAGSVIRPGSAQAFLRAFRITAQDKAVHAASKKRSGFLCH